MSPNARPTAASSEEASDAALREEIRSRYAQAARTVGASGCCGPSPAAASGGPAVTGCGCSGDSVTTAAATTDTMAPSIPSADCCSSGKADLGYDATEIGTLPPDAVAVSLGCGNPIALAELCEGETVLDLGSGGGIDVLLSARRVGATGRAYGLDMTDEMLALAQENQRKSGLANAVFLRGSIEEIPLPAASVDVVISNCVINLSTDKAKTLREAFRVLRPGGRLAVADIVTTRPMPPAVRKEAALWAGCVAGALTIEEYGALLTSAGFTGVGIEPLGPKSAPGIGGANPDTAPELAAWDGQVLSAFVRAKKP